MLYITNDMHTIPKLTVSLPCIDPTTAVWWDKGKRTTHHLPPMPETHVRLVISLLILIFRVIGLF
jgi:hypothetical protein